ncbi:FprA family A-type flavoprotein [candidate division KSB1 bacterium]|nr:FprA family A-type flavoprotein [candidate division KSB1 bacterium]
MKPIKLKDDIYWVGGIDWDLRNFHGYLTHRGSTYNAYLIIDEKITLIDTVKHYLYDEMLERISHIIDPSKIDYIVSNHVEMDHSAGLPKLMELAKNAVIVTSPNGKKGLDAHYKNDWNYKVVKSGDSLNIGKRNLQFVLTPMVHWPDNMVEYLPEEKILFSNDSFGQHLATSERFDDEYPFNTIMEEAKKYYANIVLPYSSQVNKALDALSGLDIEIIAPSHGIVWRSHIADIVNEYKKWATNQTENKALIIYDTMWGSTKKIAYAIANAFENKGVDISMLNLRQNHISDIMTQILTARYICVGSPTLNNNILPTVASFLTYLKGLAPKDRFGLAFGSYGWGGQSVSMIEESLNCCNWKIFDKIKIQYIPDEETLKEITGKVEKLIIN